VKYKNVRRWVILLTVLCMIVGLYFTFGASAQGDTTVDISPASQTVSQLQVFTVDVVVNPAVPIAGVEFDLSFDPSLLTANSVAEGNLLNQNGDPTFFLPGTIDNGNGTITGVAGTILGVGATVSSPGTFTTITFTAKTTAGNSTLDLSNVIVGDPAGDPVAIVVTDGSVTIETDTTPPTITGVQAIPITATSAVITWTTDEPADSVVNYGNTTALGLTASDATLVTSHSISLNGLLPGTTYYYEVQSTDEGGNTATDNNEGAYYTLTIYRLTGWGWCTDYTEIANAEFVANGILVPRAGAPESSDLHLVGSLTLTLSDATTESIALDMYGSKVRSLFYLHQEEEGKSASLNGVWLTWDGGQYLSAWGRITLPQGEVFKTAKLYLLQLRTPGVDIPDREPDGFVDDLEYLITVLAKFIDGLIDKLMVTDFADILGSVLAKLMVLLAAIRELGVPYIP